MQKLEIEGSLYILQRSVKPYHKLFLLNRKSRIDFSDWLTEATEFVAQEDNFIGYVSTNANNQTPRRVIYFSLAEERDEFLTVA